MTPLQKTGAAPMRLEWLGLFRILDVCHRKSHVDATGYRLDDVQWQRIAPVLAGPGGTAAELRTQLEAALWIVLTGQPWANLPATLGDGPSLQRRFLELCERGTWRVLARLLTR